MEEKHEDPKTALKYVLCSHFHFLSTIQILSNNQHFSESGYLELQRPAYGIKAV